MREILRRGIDGYLLKQNLPEQLADELHRLKAGIPPLSPDIATAMLAYMAEARSATRPFSPLESLSRREREIFDGLTAGASRNALAQRFGISHHTVATHTRSIYHKLEISTRAELGMLAARASG
ncbi:LuxR C-terminal-related transcriptional regulator [Acuticoccus sp. MNP-M23]|uniref:LuxR C-terminal-related transcriptional regulator n=1 Tax=Acuticoccus sp. MNP-M23 TaxID=3072793 RepID=UPI0028152167|nr:LuxR C-terminal-related transcriptional regulator [Acuticoccus sp. MNP-M23]WMS43899.1 LuxR C-terminal-related transcriptional regulator [Acuticoccus sp. MNP-M23]